MRVATRKDFGKDSWRYRPGVGNSERVHYEREDVFTMPPRPAIA